MDTYARESRASIGNDYTPVFDRGIMLTEYHVQIWCPDSKEGPNNMKTVLKMGIGVTDDQKNYGQ